MTAAAGGITLEIAEQAMFWYLELLEPQVSEETRAACLHWRQVHPLHEKAWLRAENLGQRMSEMRQHRPLASATLAGGVSRRRAVKQLALLLVASAAAWGVRETGVVSPMLADHRTGIGEWLDVNLTDGTRIQLNTDSAVDVQQRRIRLLRGEILVTLGRSSQGLRVETEQGAVISREGSFSVRQRAGYSQVAMLHGNARIEPRSAPARALAPSERVNFSEREVFGRRGADGELAWSQRMIVADGQRLSDFLDELSRYRHGHLGCDPALADLRVSGTYPLDDTDRVLAAVSRTLDLQIRSMTRYWVTLQPRTLGS